ncbi:MAG: 2TM domain-containing protein [Limnospira sp.]
MENHFDTHITPAPIQQEDAQEILQIAMARSQESGELTRDQLVEMAMELGISPQDLQAAEQEWQSRKVELTEKQVFNHQRRQKFRQNLIKYAIVNSFLLVLNLVTTQGIAFALTIALLWGLGLTLQGWRTFQTEGEDYEKAFSRWRLKKQLGSSLGTIADRVLKGMQS